MKYPAIVSLLGVALAFAGAPEAVATDAKPVKVVVLLESGVGGSQAQVYLDQLLSVVAKRCDWPAVASEYTTRKKRALDYIESDSPQLGLMSLGAFLSLEKTHKLEVIGEAHAAAAGGRRYHVVGKADDFSGCKGQPLASNHLSDPRFIDNVLFHGDARLADFNAVETRRPVQTIKAVIRDKARCALIDDAQLAQLASIDGGSSLETLWSSAELPPMPIVAFPGADRALITAFQGALDKLCEGEDAEVCSNIGLDGLAASNNANYAALVAAYRGSEIAKP